MPTLLAQLCVLIWAEFAWMREHHFLCTKMPSTTCSQEPIGLCWPTAGCFYSDLHKGSAWSWSWRDGPGHTVTAMTVSPMSPQAVGVAEVSPWPTARPWGREDFTGSTETQQRETV